MASKRKRDHKATLEARNRLAQAQGYRSYADKRKRRAEGKTLPTDTTAQPERRQVIRLQGTSRLVTPKGGQGEAIARSQLVRSGSFTLTATVKGVPVEMFAKGAWDSFQLVRLIDRLGTLAAAVAYMLNQGMGVGGNGPQGSDGIGEEVTAAEVEGVELEVS